MVKRMKYVNKWSVTVAAIAAILTNSSSADSMEAHCNIYPRGSDQATAMIPCTFSQRQGYVTITRSDGITHDLTPVGDAPGNYRDQEGRPAYRESGLGDQGQIYRFEDQSIYVYWNTSALKPPATEDNPTAPFTTTEYDATTILRCRAKGAPEFGSCPAGILRMENSQASIVVQNQLGEQFTINFMKDYINATNRKVDAKLEGDTWVITINGEEVYLVPLAAIEGG